MTKKEFDAMVEVLRAQVVPEAPAGPEALNMEFLHVPAGEALVGSADDDPEALSDEKPQKRVSIAAFEAGKYPVTVEQYAVFLAATGHPAPPGWEEQKKNPARPVVEVNHADSLAFCRWAGVRLLTEDEREYIARGTDGRKYPWGNAAPDSTNCNRTSGLLPVGQRPNGAGPFGHEDLAAQVYEWTSSTWTERR